MYSLRTWRNECSPKRTNPSQAALAVIRGAEAELLENVSDRLIGNGVAEIGQRARDAVTAPGGVFSGEADNELLDVSGEGQSSGLGVAPGKVPLSDDELAMPFQERGGLNNRDGVSEQFAESLAFSARVMRSLSFNLQCVAWRSSKAR